MQQPIAAWARAGTLIRACPCATCIWLLYPAPASDQDGIDPLQLELVVFSSHELVQNITYTQGGHHLQLALVVYIYTLYI